MSLFDKQLLDSVVLFERKNGRSYKSIATGFLVGFKDKSKKDNYHTFIVTNKHVVEGTRDIFVSLDIQDKKRRRERIGLINQNNDKIWFSHSNKDVDLALIPVSMDVIKALGGVNRWIPEGQFLYFKDYEKKGLNLGDDVFFAGFPLGLSGSLKNYPLLRKGSLARADKEFRRDFKSLVIDGQNFPGNSGGPVFTKPEPISLEGIDSTIDSNYLIGVIKGYIPHTSHYVSPDNGSIGSITVENSGLALYVPMDYAKTIYNAWVKSGKPIIR